MKVRFLACFFPAKILQSRDPKLLVFGVSAVIKVQVVIKSRSSFIFFEFLLSLMIKKLLNGLNFYFLVLVSLFWFL